MKMRLFPSALLLGFSLSVHAREGWFWQNPLPSANSLGVVHFTDSATGYIAGCCGDLHKTVDGGLSWRPLFIGRTDVGIWSLSFPSSEVGYVASDSGRVLKTTDAGDSWIALNTGTTGILFAVQFMGDEGHVVGNHGFAARTRNGGVSWDTASPGGNSSLMTLHFPTREVGYAGGSSGMVLKTADAGVSWEALPTPFGGTIRSIRFSHPDTGLAVGDSGVVLKTVDGGRLWTRKKLSDQYLRTLAYVDSRTVLTSGWEYRYRSTDGGSTWSSLRIPSGIDYESAVHFPDRNTGYSVGYRSRIWKTTDQGQTWREMQTGNPSQFLYGVAFTSPSQGYAVGTGGLIARTRDGGRSWSFQHRPLYAPELNAVFFVDPAHGYIAGGDAFDGGGLVLRTVDQGETWYPLSTGVGSPLRAIHFTDSLNGVVVGGYQQPSGAITRSGLIIRTTDGGLHWDSLPMPPFHILYAVHFPEKDVGYACGDSGDVFRTVDAGAHWTRLTSSPVAHQRAIRFLDAATGVMGGDRGLYRTEDSGGTWIRYARDTTGNWNSISLAGGDTIWVVGEGLKAMRSADGGKTWVDFHIPTNVGMNGGYFLNGTNGYAVGHYGAILRYGPEIEAPLSLSKPAPKPQGTGKVKSLGPNPDRMDIKGFDANGRWKGNTRSE